MPWVLDVEALKAKLAALKKEHADLDEVIARWAPAYLEEQGFKLLPAKGGIAPGVDVVASSDKGMVVIEAKNLQSRPLGYDSIAQIRHAAESLGRTYRQECVPLIVGSFSVSESVRQVAEKNGVTLIGLDNYRSQRGLSGWLLGALQKLSWIS